MEKINAIIVDDEPEARDIIASLLADFADVEVLSKDASVEEAYRSVLKYHPDIIFLDIEMPGKGGFELVRMLKTSQISTTIIFITAYNQFAIDAIKHAAFDYLLKPVDIDELKASIRRYREEVKNVATLHRIENLLQALREEKIRFSSRSGAIYLNPADIMYCQADGNYCDLYLVGSVKQTVTMNLGRLEDTLPGTRFCKISRSVIINRQYLSEINRKERTCLLKGEEDSILLNISPKYMNLLSME